MEQGVAISPPEAEPKPWTGEIEPEVLTELAFKAKDDGLSIEEQQEYFHAIAGGTYSSVYNLVSRITQNHLVAQEITQETYERAWKHRKKFRGESSYGSFLYRIAVNSANTVIKKAGRVKKHEVSEHDLFDEDDSADDMANAHVLRPKRDIESVDNVYDSVEHSELKRRVTAALGRLSLTYRTILVLRHIEDLSHEEISDVLGIKINASKTRLSRASEKLREIWSAMENKEGSE